MTREEAVGIALSVPGLLMADELALLWDAAMQAPVGQFVELGVYLGRSGALLAQAAKGRGRECILIDRFRYHRACSLEAVQANLAAGPAYRGRRGLSRLRAPGAPGGQAGGGRLPGRVGANRAGGLPDSVQTAVRRPGRLICRAILCA